MMNKDKIIECGNELQNHMFRGLSAKESFEILSKKYDEDTIQIAMKMLKTSREHDDSPYKEMSNTITRCMSKLGEPTKEDLNSVESFYKLSERAYKVFMNDKMGRAIPIVFMYVKGSPRLGVCPITEDDPERSPMDYLKEIVYNAKPDAYCFCGEASMSTDVGRSEYEYGDICKDPKSIDIVVMSGNSKTGNDPFNKGFTISGSEGNLSFTEMDNFGTNMESEKLP